MIFKLGGGTEQSGIAADAAENALVVNIQIFAGVGSFGGCLARDCERGRRKLFSPFFLGLRDCGDGELLSEIWA